MPNFNHARYLTTALSAILSQSRPPDEVLILDDCSTDDSLEIIRRITDEFSLVRYEVNEQNIGAVRSMNRLLQRASTDYVFFAAADDLVLPNFFEESMCLLEASPQAALCSSRSRLIDERGKDLGVFPSQKVLARPGCIDAAEARQLLGVVGNWVMGNTTIYRREPLLEVGGFDPDLLSNADGFIQQVLVAKHGACYIPEPRAAWRRTSGSFSSKVLGDSRALLHIERRGRELLETRYRGFLQPGYAMVWAVDKRFEAARAAAAHRCYARDSVTPSVTPIFARSVSTIRYGLMVVSLIARYRPWLALRRRFLRITQDKPILSALSARLLGLPK